MIRKIFVLSAILLCGSMLTAEEAAKTYPEADMKLCYEFFSAMKMEKQFRDMSTQMLNLQVQSNPMLQPFRPEMENFFNRYVNYQTMKEGLAKIYLEIFKPAEIREFIKFYRTPAGQALADKTTLLSAKAAGLSQEIVMKHMPELQKAIEAKALKLQQQKKTFPQTQK